VSEHSGNEPDSEEASVLEVKNVPFDDETIIWEGSPSQWVNIGTYIFWSFFLLASFLLLKVWNGGQSEGYTETVDLIVPWAAYALIVISVFVILMAYLTVRYEYTVITRNKIKESKGITRIFRRDLFCELSDVEDVKSPPAGIMGLLGLSNLVIETSDADQPVITIRAIRNREQLINDFLPIWRKLKMDRKGYFGER